MLNAFDEIMRRVLCGASHETGGEGAATAPATSLDKTVQEMAKKSLKECRAEKYAVGTRYQVKASESDTEYFERREDGVYLITDKEERKICDPLDVVGKSRNAEGHKWGRVVVFKDSEGGDKRMALSMKDILGGGNGLSIKLGDEGLHVLEVGRGGGLPPVNRYLNSFPPEDLKTIKTVDKGGWSGGYLCFVFGDRLIRVDGGDVVELSADVERVANRSCGTLEKWKEFFSGFASHSVRVEFAAMVALASPLIPIVGDMCRIFHFFGPTSTGKSSATKFAATVFGDISEEWVNSWKGTDNSPEAVAAKFNNLPLIFDELKLAGTALKAAAYVFSSGVGKSRCNTAGRLQDRATWSLYGLSTGEASLVEMKRQIAVGKDAETATGELVRNIDIFAIANPERTEYGVFDNFPKDVDATDENDRQRWIDSFMSHPKAYGVAGPAFIEAIERDIAENGVEVFRQNFRAAMDRFKTRATTSSSAMARVLTAFAIVAATGELARGYGILPLKKGEAADIALTCFDAWKVSAGTLEDREENFVNAVLDDPRVCVNNYVRYDDGVFSSPEPSVGSAPAYGTLLTHTNDGTKENVAAFYNGKQFEKLVERTRSGYMQDEALAVLKKHKRLLAKGGDEKRRNYFRAPKREKSPIPLGLTSGSMYILVPVSPDVVTAIRALDAVGLNPPKDVAS